MKFHWYKYIDDTGNSWFIKLSDYIAEAGVLEEVPVENRNRLRPLPPNYKPRHIKLVELDDRPGKQKYRANVVTNERNPSKLLNKVIMVQGMQMQCIRYIGEQRPLW